VDRVGFGSCVGKILPPTPNSKLPVFTPSGLHPKTRFTDFKLYSFSKSSCAWRVRIGLNAKKVQYQLTSINIFKKASLEEFTSKNQMAQVPTLEFLDTHNNNEVVRISQSLAILQFLDQAFPEKPSVSKSSRNDDPLLDVAINHIAEIVNSSIQPLQNKLLLTKMKDRSNGQLDTNQFAIDAIIRGFEAIQKLIPINQEKYGGPYAVGTFCPTLADFCLIPQVYNARGFGIDVDTLFPDIAKIEKLCEVHPWFIPAHPDNQID